MRLVFRYGGETLAVDLAREPGGGWRIAAAGQHVTAAPRAAGPGLLVVELDGRPVRAVVARDGTRWWVALGGDVAAFEEATDDEGSAGAAHGPLEVVSPIPGRVLTVLVEPGDEVEAGQVVVSVEAMKMENGLKAERAARVARVLVAPGDRVESGQLLVELAAGP